MRINETIEFLQPFADDDPILVGLICDALIKVDRTKDAIILLAQKIKEFPMLVTLLLKQANAFIKYEYYEYAILLAKICVDLCPESFECWICLAETYFHMWKFSLSLICIDIAPFYPDEQHSSGFPQMDELVSTQPRTQNSSSIFPEYMLSPDNPDFRESTNEDVNRTNVDPAHEDVVLEKITKANTRELNNCEKKSYDLLVKMEKEISWEALLKIKTKIFLAETDDAVVWENPHLNADYARTGSQSQENTQDESFVAIQKSANSFFTKKAKG